MTKANIDAREAAARRILNSRMVQEGEEFTYALAQPYAKMNGNCTRKLLVWMAKEGYLTMTTRARRNYYRAASHKSMAHKPWRAESNDFLIGHVPDRLGVSL